MPEWSPQRPLEHTTRSETPPRTTPFPTTRQLFTLKGYDYPRLAARYAAASSRQKQRILTRTARVPRSAITPWQQPRRLGIEWFGSTQDICRAFAGLQRQAGNPRLAPVGRALSLNDGGLALDPAAYPVTWFKGGSEPGVLTLNHLVRAADGSVLVTSLMLENPTTAFDEDTVVPRALAIVRGAIALAHPIP